MSFQETSKRTFIYDVKVGSFTEGPSMLSPREDHSSCSIQSDDGSIQSIIIIGGMVNYFNEKFSKTTEIFDIKEQKWAKGPDLPIEITEASSVSLPPTANFACVLIGGQTETDKWTSNVYGLTKSLKEWKFLGTIRTSRKGHLALSLF